MLPVTIRHRGTDAWCTFQASASARVRQVPAWGWQEYSHPLRSCSTCCDLSCWMPCMMGQQMMLAQAARLVERQGTDLGSQWVPKLEACSAGACCTLQLPLRTDPAACSMHCLLARPQRGATSPQFRRWVIWTMTTENMLHESSAKRSAGVASFRYGPATFQDLSTWMLYSCEASSGLPGSWHGDSTGPMWVPHVRILVRVPSK